MDIKNFIKEYKELCLKYGVSLKPEGCYMVIEPYSEKDIEKINNATIIDPESGRKEWLDTHYNFIKKIKTDNNPVVIFGRYSTEASKNKYCTENDYNEALTAIERIIVNPRTDDLTRLYMLEQMSRNFNKFKTNKAIELIKLTTTIMLSEHYIFDIPNEKITKQNIVNRLNNIYDRL